MNNRQKRFVEEYLVDINATQAAIRAGYSQKSARSIGAENLTKPDISEAISERMMSADEVIIQPKCPIPVHEFNDNIQINHVSFAYDTQEVLSDISFEIKKGECIALVGQSGAGKSTFADLLERFYDPTKGEILIDGIDIKYYDINNLRSLYALVSQDVVLFNDSLYNNIAIGMPNVQEKDIIEAAKVEYL